ncbi:unnamed protein product [Linum tenue]|uniref:Uncharacterized protein n=1 Tax=Linum tenue TaxID=586396 RepID=A0AAV0RYH7_9ROSI|nr:unnamed protein product [Linum tenue]
MAAINQWWKDKLTIMSRKDGAKIMYTWTYVVIAIDCSFSIYIYCTYGSGSVVSEKEKEKKERHKCAKCIFSDCSKQ